MTTPLPLSYVSLQVNTMLRECCIAGDLNALRSLLTCENHHADVVYHLDAALMSASLNGHLEIVRFLLTSPELVQHSDILANDCSCLRMACTQGHLAIVKYLLTSPELEVHANVQAQDNRALMDACGRNHVEVFKYLLKSPELSEHANPNDTRILKAILQGNHTEMLNLLLCDMELVVPEEFYEELSDDCIAMLRHGVEKRELFRNLHNLKENTPDKKNASGRDVIAKI